jgi:hypothetical protein
VYAGALGSGLQLLSPSVLEVDSTSVSVVGYDKPLLSLSLWTRVKFSPNSGRSDPWYRLHKKELLIAGGVIGGAILIIVALAALIGTGVGINHCQKNEKYCFKHNQNKAKEESQPLKDEDSI